MITRVKFSPNYGTHLYPLMKAMELTDGPVLELGIGLFSTPYLHYACLLHGRQLVSYDNAEYWSNMAEFYRAPWHELICTENWDEIDIERPWDVVLVDHSPDHRRAIEIKRLADWAKFIVVHDTNGRFNRIYGFEKVFPQFKYCRGWTITARHVAILSNFEDPGEL